MTALETQPRVDEVSPSEVQTVEPTFARVLAAVGIALLLLGNIAIIANTYGPRIIGTSGGYLFAALGAALLLFHAHRDGDFEFRRAHTFLGYLVIAAFVVTGVMVLMGRDDGVTISFRRLPILAGSGALMPPILALFGLALLNATYRHETAAQFRNITMLLWLIVGLVGSAGVVIAGIVQPDFLVGPGIILALIGLAYLTTFLSNIDTSGGVGFAVALGLGLFGTVALVYALARSIWPTVLFEGPAAIQTPLQTRDNWKLAARFALILACLGVALWGVLARRANRVARLSTILVGLSFASVFAYGCFAKSVSSAPTSYFVPFGLLLGLIGIIFIVFSAGLISESSFIALTRREIASFFVSPIAYILLGGTALVASFGYSQFVSLLSANPNGWPEPILQLNISLEIIAAISVLFVVPALTMRAFSEEKRNATLEVLLTAPVSESAIVLSKFAACWLMYVLTFVPAGLYLIALRAESGPFDYRPLLSYYLAVGLCGVAFVGMGLFFSSLTSNQIIAAVLTFAGMLFLLLTTVLKQLDLFNNSLRLVIGRFDFLELWRQTLSGVLPVAQGITYASLGVFWLYLTVKVLESRKWG